MLGLIRLVLALTGADIFTRTAPEAGQSFSRTLGGLLSSASPACASVQHAPKCKLLMAGLPVGDQSCSEAGQGLIQANSTSRYTEAAKPLHLTWIGCKKV